MRALFGDEGAHVYTNINLRPPYIALEMDEIEYDSSSSNYNQSFAISRALLNINRLQTTFTSSYLALLLYIITMVCRYFDICYFLLTKSQFGVFEKNQS